MDASADDTRAERINSEVLLCLPTALVLLLIQNGDFGTSPIYGHHRTRHFLPLNVYMGRRARNAMGLERLITNLCVYLRKGRATPHSGTKPTCHVRVASVLPPDNGHSAVGLACPQVPCVDGSELARAFFTFAALVGAAMCSPFKRGTRGRWPQRPPRIRSRSLFIVASQKLSRERTTVSQSPRPEAISVMDYPGHVKIVLSTLCRSGRRTKEVRPPWEAAFLFMANSRPRDGLR
jgi:hypothetical protein